MNTFTKARYEILNELLAFPAISDKDWISHGDPLKGDLVSLRSAPSTEWYLSWVVDTHPNNGWPKYLLRSIETDNLCWWENVGINIYNREKVKNRPSWKWSDKQFAFNKKWKRACFKHDAYIVLPCQADFNDKSVTLSTRTRFNLGESPPSKTFDNWRKLLSRDMQEFYLKSVEIYNQRKAG